jgi:hypothetical protein
MPRIDLLFHDQTLSARLSYQGLRIWLARFRDKNQPTVSSFVLNQIITSTFIDHNRQRGEKIWMIVKVHYLETAPCGQGTNYILII